jgi:hypothetical protein
MSAPILERLRDCLLRVVFWLDDAAASRGAWCVFAEGTSNG